MTRRVSARRVYQLYVKYLNPLVRDWEAQPTERQLRWEDFAYALYEEHQSPAKLGTDIDVAERVGYLRSGADYSDVTSEEVKMETLTEDPLAELAAQTQEFDDGVSLFGPTESVQSSASIPRLVQLATDLDDMLVGWRARARRKVEDACQRLLDFVREDDNE